MQHIRLFAPTFHTGSLRFPRNMMQREQKVPLMLLHPCFLFQLLHLLGFRCSETLTLYVASTFAFVALI